MVDGDKAEEGMEEGKGEAGMPVGRAEGWAAGVAATAGPASTGAKPSLMRERRSAGSRGCAESSFGRLPLWQRSHPAR